MALPRNFNSGQKKMPPLPDVKERENPVQPSDIVEEEFIQMTEEEVIDADFLDDAEDEALEEIVNEEEEEQLSEAERELIDRNNKVEFDDPFPEGSEIENEEFIDRKKRKMKPFGGKKSKKVNAKAKDFDDRKNQLTTIRIIRIVVMLVILGLFGFGIKNTFFPSHVYTREDIENISMLAIGETGFPMEKGEAFATQFATAYFDYDSSDSNSRRILDSFYGGSSKADSQVGSVTTVGDTKQRVVVPPRVFSSSGITDEIATFKVSTLITDKDSGKFNKDGEMTAKWVGLAITLYYDKDKTQMFVAKDSPQLIPSYSVGNEVQWKQESKLGTGQANSELFDSMAPTINGFLLAYGKASPDSHSELDQYVKKDPDPELLDGFNGNFLIKEDSITSTNTQIYPSTSDEGNNEYKVDLNLNWVDSAAQENDNNVTYNGRYVMTIEKSKDDKYFVTAFRPYIYTPDTTADE